MERAEGVPDEAQIGHGKSSAAGAEAEQQQCVTHTGIEQPHQRQILPVVSKPAGPKPELTEEQEALIKRAPQLQEAMASVELAKVSVQQAQLISDISASDTVSRPVVTRTARVFVPGRTRPFTPRTKG